MLLAICTLCLSLLSACNTTLLPISNEAASNMKPTINNPVDLKTDNSLLAQVKSDQQQKKNTIAPSDEITVHYNINKINAPALYTVNKREFGDSAYLLSGLKNGNTTVLGMATAIASTDHTCLMVTNHHMTHGVENISVKRWFNRYSNTTHQRHTVKVIKTFADIDISILEIPSYACKSAIVGSIDMSDTNQVRLVSQPIKGIGAVKHGTVAGLWSLVDLGPTLVIDSNLHKGSSGGGVYDDFNQLIGINTSIDAKKSSYAYAIPISIVLERLKKLEIITYE